MKAGLGPPLTHATSLEIVLDSSGVGVGGTGVFVGGGASVGGTGVSVGTGVGEGNGVSVGTGVLVGSGIAGTPSSGVCCCGSKTGKVAMAAA